MLRRRGRPIGAKTAWRVIKGVGGEGGRGMGGSVGGGKGVGEGGMVGSVGLGVGNLG